MSEAQTLNPARAVAVRVLAQVLSGDRFAAPALDEALTRRKLEARDAGLATHIVYGALRHHYTLNAALAPRLRGPTQTKVRALLLAGAFEKLVLGTPPHAVVNEYVNLARKEFGRIAGLVNAVLRHVELPPATPETQFNLPVWLMQEFQGAYAERADDVMRDQLQPAPLWLWLSDEGIRAMEEEGAVVEPGHADVFRVALPRPLRTTRAYQRGQAQPINPASFAVVEALGHVKDVRVLDLAGGAGVKAAMLAARGAQVTSVDVDARKHRAAQENLARLHLRADYLAADLRTTPDIESADLVLLDAPCTGTGTLRAHPEIKLRLTPDAVLEMHALQQLLLASAAALVKPGGILVYSVCSLTEAEGPQVVEALLNDRREFEADEVSVSVPTVEAKHGVRTLADNGLDGFYIAKLRRAT